MERGAVEPSLDFLSLEFDAERALHTSVTELVLPYPNIKPCDNLKAYESLLNGTRRRKETDAKPETQDLSRSAAEEATLGSGISTNPPSRSRKRVKTVIDFMEGDHAAGPFTLLQRWWRERAAVCVWIRHSAGVRGTCKGRVMAFDKHFNLVLADVREDFVPFRSIANGGRNPKKRKKRGGALAIPEPPCDGKVPSLSRQLTRLFVRGDNVVMVAGASD